MVKYTKHYVYAGHKADMVKFVAKPYVKDNTAVSETHFVIESNMPRFTHNVKFDIKRRAAWTKEVHGFFENGCGFPYLTHCVNSYRGDNNERMVISHNTAKAYEMLLGPYLALGEYLRDQSIHVLLTYQKEDYNSEYADVWLPVNIANINDMLPTDWWKDHYMLQD